MQTEAVWRALPRKIREVLAEKDLHDLQEIRLDAHFHGGSA